MGQGVKRTQRDYSLTFKLALVEQIEKSELSCQQAQSRYSIQGNSTILVWLTQKLAPRLSRCLNSLSRGSGLPVSTRMSASSQSSSLDQESRRWSLK